MTPLYINVNSSDKSNALVQGPQYPKTPASLPDLVAGNKLPVKIAFVDGNPDTDGFAPWSAVAGNSLRVVLTRQNKHAESGLFEVEGELANFDVSAATLKTLLNTAYTGDASKEVETVDGSNGLFTVYFKQNGAQDLIDIDVTGLNPICNVRVDTIRVGTVSVPAIQRIIISQAPIVEVTDWVQNDGFYEGVLPLDGSLLSELLERKTSANLWLEVIVTDSDNNPVTYLLKEVSVKNGFGGEPGVPSPSTLSGLLTRTEAYQKFILNRYDITGLVGGDISKLDSIATVALSAGTILVFNIDGVKHYAELTAGTTPESVVEPIVIRPDDYNETTNAKVWVVSTTRGEKGTDASAVTSSADEPTGGVDGDLHFRTSNWDVYKNVSGSWTIVGNIKGEIGAAGTNGLNGLDGNRITVSAIDPISADGLDDDIHLNTDTKDLFQKVAGTWTLLGNIGGGPAGAAAEFTSGATAPDDLDGENGFAYINTTNGDFYIKSAGTWGSPIGNFTGPIGATGTRGSKWFYGSAAPGTISGSLDNDLYFRTSNNALYIKTSGSWGSPIANLSGTAGNQIRVGTGVPSDSLGADGDVYINDANGAMYKKSGSTWGSPFYTIATGGGGGGTWGSITGTLEDQTDLQAALDAKASETYVDGEINTRVPQTDRGAANGVATLDASSKLHTSQLPDHEHDASDITGLTSALAAKAPTINSDTASGGVSLISDAGLSKLKQLVAGTNISLTEVTGGIRIDTPNGTLVEYLTENRTVYVSTTGNDSNDGLTTGNAMATIQAALNKLSKIHLNGYNYIVSILSGTYNSQAIISVCPVGYGRSNTTDGRVIIQGNTGTASDIVLNGDGTNSTIRINDWWYTVKDLSVNGTVAVTDCITCYEAYDFRFSNVAFGAASVQLRAAYNSYVVMDGNCSSTANASYWFYVDHAYLVVAGKTFAFGTRTYSNGVLVVAWQGYIYAASFASTGSVTGKKYHLLGLSIGDSITTIPGSVAGTSASGSQVV